MGTFTLNMARVERLSPEMSNMADFKELFGEGLGQAACAAVKITTKRAWVRLVGMRYDLQLWKPDERPPPMPGFSRKYTNWCWKILA